MGSSKGIRCAAPTKKPPIFRPGAYLSKRDGSGYRRAPRVDNSAVLFDGLRWTCCGGLRIERLGRLLRGCLSSPQPSPDPALKSPSSRSAWLDRGRSHAGCCGNRPGARAVIGVDVDRSCARDGIASSAVKDTWEIHGCNRLSGQGGDGRLRGTDGSNPPPSTSESTA
jgi:hypothetical protein